jgi:hypothetical protein
LQIEETWDYWVMKTDYTSYAITYTCLEKSGNNCTWARAWLWGRGKTLPIGVKQEARDMWSRNCMNLTLL